jgi:hypothetical protein
MKDFWNQRYNEHGFAYVATPYAWSTSIIY